MDRRGRTERETLCLCTIQSILLMYVSRLYGQLPQSVTLGVGAPDQGSGGKNE